MNLRVIERVAVIETEHGSFGKLTVVNTNARLLLREMHERNIRFTCFSVVQHGMPAAEGPPGTVLTRQSDRDSFQKERPERERLGVMPFIRAASLKYFALMIEDDAFYLRLNIEAIWHTRQPIHNDRQNFLADRSRLGCACVFRLEHSRRFFELCLFICLLFLARFNIVERQIQPKLKLRFERYGVVLTQHSSLDQLSFV